MKVMTNDCNTDHFSGYNISRRLTFSHQWQFTSSSRT